MLARLTFAPVLLLFGVVLGLLGLVLWKTLPIPMSWPPFGLTSLTAIVCGALDWFWRHRQLKHVQLP